MTDDLERRLRLIAAWRKPGGKTPAEKMPNVHRATTEAADEIARLRAENEALREHIREQANHVETRIQDGIEMGASVWRIALEDVARENRQALQEGSRHE